MGTGKAGADDASRTATPRRAVVRAGGVLITSGTAFTLGYPIVGAVLAGPAVILSVIVVLTALFGHDKVSCRACLLLGLPWHDRAGITADACSSALLDAQPEGGVRTLYLTEQASPDDEPATGDR